MSFFRVAESIYNWLGEMEPAANAFKASLQRTPSLALIMSVRIRENLWNLLNPRYTNPIVNLPIASYIVRR